MFGEVVHGMDVVKAVEKVGSKDGKTSKKVIIGRCGVVEEKHQAGDEKEKKVEGDEKEKTDDKGEQGEKGRKG